LRQIHIAAKVEGVRVFGLTGGLGSGKSTVARRFRERVPVIDADDLAREVVAPGQPALAEIAEQFGPGVLTAEGSLDRSALAAIVFADPSALAQLNKITHPRVAALLQTRLAALETQGIQTACYELPLLFENNLEQRYQPTVLVAASTETQITRALGRSGLSREQALARIGAQLPLSEKAARADYVIDNDGSLEATFRQADAVLSEIINAP
jgi:dephospho-CoA kinase